MERKNPASTRQDVRTADGFAAAVKSIERLLFAVSYSVLGNSDACSDAVQSALLKAWKNRLTLQNGARFKSWMVQIVQNESRNYLRKRPNLPLDENTPCAEEDPARCDVRQAVAGLPEDARLVVMLYYFERYPVRDICARLNLPEGTVHSRLFRAREQLRKELTDYEHERSDV